MLKGSCSPTYGLAAAVCLLLEHVLGCIKGVSLHYWVLPSCKLRCHAATYSRYIASRSATLTWDTQVMMKRGKEEDFSLQTSKVVGGEDSMRTVLKCTACFNAIISFG